MNGPVLFLDSGIGGLPYARHFLDTNPKERIVYVADRANFPYGAKSRDDLRALLRALAGRLIETYRPKLVVLACNTATVSALVFLRAEFPALPWVGTVPAIKPAVSGSRTRVIGVLGTRRTVEDPYLDELAREWGGGCAIIRSAAPALVEFVENGGDFAPEEEQRRAVSPYIAEFIAAGADGIVLGCTHFLFLLESFRAEAKALADQRGGAMPPVAIYESVEGVSRRASDLLDRAALRAGSPRGTDHSAKNILVLTGSLPPSPLWEKRARVFSLEPGTLP